MQCALQRGTEMSRLLALVAVFALSLVIAGCATGVKGSPRRICYDAGYEPGTLEFSNCWKSVRNKMFEADAAAIGIGAAAALSVNSRNSIPLPNSNLTASRWLPRRSSFESWSSIWLCPNGVYVFGRGCYAAPNGSYTGEPPRLAPDGSWVGGLPKLAPNGRYVGGTGPLSLCPDGSYVAAPRCQLMPNGTYLGVP